MCAFFNLSTIFRFDSAKIALITFLISESASDAENFHLKLDSCERNFISNSVSLSLLDFHHQEEKKYNLENIVAF